MITRLRKLFRRASKAVPFVAPPRQRLMRSLSEFSAIYAIGDVHGCYSELLRLEQRIVADAALDPGSKLLVMLGDYIDRGPNSRAVLEHLCRPPPPGFERVALCGNHDDSFWRFLQAPTDNRSWLDFGGKETLYSYGIDASQILRQGGGVEGLAQAANDKMPGAHRDLLETMPIALSVDSLIFVHAGIRPGIPLENQVDSDLMWIREPFLSEGSALASVVIHGHSPSTDATFSKGRIGIDTGAYATGKLTALKIAEGRARVL